MSKRRWFDCNGEELFAGDIVREVDSGKEELVYECHPDGYPDQLNLGLNASNERFLELYPTWQREIYPFDNFSHTLDGEGCGRLKDYEKVVQS